jgi:ABC-type dipeptide/oligopeptide/nickel transport system permease component
VIKLHTIRRLIQLVAIPAFVLALGSAQSLVAQGCALCYAQAASSTHRFIQALRSGILILVIPPMVLSVMFAVMAYRRRNSFNQELPEEFELDRD